MITILISLITLTFIGISVFISLSQIAIFSLTQSTVSHFKHSSDQNQQNIVNILKQPHKLLVSLLFCDISANIFIQNCFAKIFDGFSNQWIFKVIIPIIITLFIGELFPKIIALPNNERISISVIPYISKINNLLSPCLSWISNGTNKASSFILKIFNLKTTDIQPQELKHVLRNCHSLGIVNADEYALIHGYVSLSDSTVKDRMRPREEIIFYDLENPISELFAVFSGSNLSRIPVCSNDIQNIKGICYANDILTSSINIDEKNLTSILHKPYYIPETISTKNALRNLIAKKESMGIVIDEYGSISGIITLDNLFKIVVGEVIDTMEESHLYTKTGNNVIIANGKLELSEFEHIFHQKLYSKNNVVTIGGWITEKLGSIPKSGTHLESNGYLFKIIDAEKHRIRRIYIRRINNES